MHKIFARVLLIGLLLALPTVILAQAPQVTLVGRAVLPANTLADGPKSGLALGKKAINGIRVPFDSQPVGSISAIIPGDYSGTWLALSNGIYDKKQNSGDFLLRIYIIEIDFRKANGGGGTVALDDWRTLTDPGKNITAAIQNNDSRELTGAEFNPVAFRRTQDGSFWVADSYGPSLLHFDQNGKLLDAPIALGSGLIQGIGRYPDGKTLLVAMQAGASQTAINLLPFHTDSKTLDKAVSVYSLDIGTHSLGAFTLINDHQALAVEQDNQQNKSAQFKRVFLVDFSANPATKTPIADLLNIADPNGISTADVFSDPGDAFGLGASFKFPYTDISGIYPENAQTLVVVNNNHFPFGLGRSKTRADDTEYIEIQLAQPLTIDPAFQMR